ncbi:MAG TPA: HD domain-containing protein [Kineosporiaceae bacterium]
MDAPWAEQLAERLLAEPLPDRWAHSRGVGLKARELRQLAGEHADTLEAAAFLHDIGYAPPLVDTGFHPLDGAHYLRDHTDAPPLLCTLVAHHTCAIMEAEARGLDDVLLAEFPLHDDLEHTLVAAITHCDLSVGPTGSPTDAQHRIAEILARYPRDNPVHQAIQRARPVLLRQDQMIRGRLPPR